MPNERAVLPGRTVVHVIAPAEVGGAESVVRELAAGRHRLGGNTQVVALLERPGPHPLVDGLQVAGHHHGYFQADDEARDEWRGGRERARRRRRHRR